MSSATKSRSTASPRRSATIASIARRISAGGAVGSGSSSSRRAMSFRVSASRASGKWMATIPSSPHAMPHRPIAVSNNVHPIGSAPLACDGISRAIALDSATHLLDNPYPWGRLKRHVDATRGRSSIAFALSFSGVGIVRLANKVAVITGGASGMGRSTVLRFLAEGARVVIADYNATTGERTLQEAVDSGHGAATRFIRTDVAKEADIERMLKHAVDAFGRLDIVFNNAGVGGAIGPLTETTVEDWDYTFDVLAKGVFLGIKHAARILRAEGQGGSIINTASIAGLSGDAGPLVYSAAKAAVIHMTRAA